MWPFKPKNQIKIVFDTDTAGLGHHGTIVATNRSKGMVNAMVRYSFIGMEVPPALSREIFNHIVDEASRNGWEFHHLRNHNYNQPGHMSLQAGSFNRSNPTAKGFTDMSTEDQRRLDQVARIKGHEHA